MGLKSSPIKRRQIINEIMDSIRTGKLVSGERLAPVRDLAKHFNVSLSVVQNAMRELIGNGFVECRGHSGFYVCSSNPENPVGKTETVQKDTNGRIILNAVHHSDLVWRHTYEEYDAIREEQLKHLLKLAKKYQQFHFAVEQAEIIRIYLRDNPDDLKVLRELCDSGRFEPLGGLCIPDLNLISGESIVRNLLAGRRYWKNTFGSAPEIACMSDAFGMCAQLPQLLVKCGFRYLLPGRMPNRPGTIPGNGPFRWFGLDNTSISVAHSSAEITQLGYDCNVPVLRDETVQLARCVSALRYLPGPALVQYMTEESQIREDLFLIVENANRNSERLIEFGSHRGYMESVAWADAPVFHGEFNPVFTGCYTTRIGVKQLLRQAENLLFKTEFLDALSPLKCDFDSCWHELNLAQFHDAACGCHTDAAHKDVMAKIGSVISFAGKSFPKPSGKSFSICNFNNISEKQLVRAGSVPAGVKAQQDGSEYLFEAELPPCGIRSFRKSDTAPAKCKAAPAKFETDFFAADFSAPYPVIRNKNGENVFAPENFGEILIRCDYGTMWAEQFMNCNRGRAFQQEKVVDITEGPVFFKAVTEGKFLPARPSAGNLGSHWPGFGSLSFRKEYYFPRHLDYFSLKLTLDWKGCNTKIAVRFPLSLKLRETFETYEVPFGSIVRKPYFEVSSDCEHTFKPLASQQDYSKASGDWPALDWVNYSDMTKGLTLANRGTPGHQLVNGNIIVSLIRSGTGILDGGMVPQEGSFDNGTHTFEFAFRAHSPLEMEKACDLGQILNRPPEICSASLPEGSMLAWDAGSIRLSACRRLDDAVLVRFCEMLGRQTETRLSGQLLDRRQLFETDMEGKNPVQREKESISFHPFEIKTFIIK